MNITKGVGVIIIGAAEGVGQGLKTGLAKRIEELIAGKGKGWKGKGK
jgi:hypothetical protein